MEKVRVLIADDHAVVRSGLSAFLMTFDDLELVGQAANGAEAVRLCQQLQPDVVLMDLVMPGMDGVAATREIRRCCPHSQVLALTSYKDDDLVRGVLQAGAIGYLLKRVSADELAEAIRAANAGRPTLVPEATQALLRAVAQPPPAPCYDLTPREIEVLALLVKGLSNIAMAEQLGVSQSTVKFHVSSILSKLGVSSRTEAVVLAVKHRLVEAPD